MSLKVHHVNLATMCPIGGRFIDGGQGSIFSTAELSTHALVVETPKDGLVLVDAGMGVADARAKLRRLGAGFAVLARPRFEESDTAIRQVERLGFSGKDVRHVVVTHLDVDHAGGLADFPEATVHVHRAEQRAALERRTTNERHRYKPIQLAHAPRWKLHEAEGERWFGLESVRAVAEDILLVPLPGHTRRHSAIAVRVDELGGPEWLLHCGDAYFFHLEKDDPECCPSLLARFQSVIAVDDRARRANAARLRELHQEHGRKVRLFSAHDMTEYKSCRGKPDDRSG